MEVIGTMSRVDVMVMRFKSMIKKTRRDKIMSEVIKQQKVSHKFNGGI